MKINKEYSVLVIDNMIKLVIARTYINMKARKLLTAQKILEAAMRMIKEYAPIIYRKHEQSEQKLKELLNMRNEVREADAGEFDLQINQLELENRFDVELMPLDILKQKYYAQKGQLLLVFKQEAEALDYFKKCLKTGYEIDLRIRLECLRQIQNIYAQRN